MQHKQLGYLGIDQYGNHYHIVEHPRKELVEQIGNTNVRKMYCDLKSGGIRHKGYVIGNLWIDVYRICQWKEGL